MAPIRNMRICFYGTQGSGSTFPSQEERGEYREMLDCELLRQVFEDIQQRTAAGGQISIEDVLGGPLNSATLRTYRNKFELSELRVYGGWTTCVLLETSDGYDIVLDCGSGFRHCAHDLQTKWADRAERHLFVFGSHSHLDHTEGFDQAAVCFDPRNTIHVYGNRQFLLALDSKLGIFSRRISAAEKGVHTPISYDVMPARFQSCEIQGTAPQPSPGDGVAQHYHDQSEPITLGKTKIVAFEVDHPAPCLAYRIEHNDKVFVFCTDHELRHDDANAAAQQQSLEAEERLLAHAQGADVLYRDGQYLRAEYDGLKGVGDSNPVPRLGWGHSCIEDVLEMAEKAGIARTYIGHHDPNRPWGERYEIDEDLARRSKTSSTNAELARAETVVDL